LAVSIAGCVSQGAAEPPPPPEAAAPSPQPAQPPAGQPEGAPAQPAAAQPAAPNAQPPAPAPQEPAPGEAKPETPAPGPSATFKLQPQQGVMGKLVSYYRPVRVMLSAKPEEKLTKEPQYNSKEPLYGTLQVGDGPDNHITLVVDEAEGKPPRVYLDRNNDQDLTNDGPGEWSRDAGDILALSDVVIDVPYKTGKVPYTFQFYRFKNRLHDAVLCYRDADREGEITSDGKTYKIAVLDENADGRFDDLDADTMLIDLNQDGRLEGDPDSAEFYSLAEPFNVHGKVWQAASLSPDGTELVLRPSDAKVEMKMYLDVGYPAPAFAGKDLDDKSIDLKQSPAGTKYVLLDFWASWCGPCRSEFPNFRRLYAQYKDHGLRVIGVNLDEDHTRAADAAKKEMLDYPHVFDGKGWENAVAVLYRVHGIPQTYLLDADLKIVAKDLRGEGLAARLRELLGPGDEAAAAAVDKKMAEQAAAAGSQPGEVPPALQERLKAVASVLSALKGVEQADVQLNLGAGGPPGISVRVKPTGEGPLADELQKVIRSAVTLAFPGLPAERVTIVDLSRPPATPPAPEPPPPPAPAPPATPAPAPPSSPGSPPASGPAAAAAPNNK